MHTKIQIITDKSTDFDVSTEVEILNTVENTADALENVVKHNPTIVFIDYELEKENTGIFIKAILAESPGSKIILLGSELVDDIVVGCLFVGAFGYLDWGDKSRFFNKLIDVVAKGEAWFSRRIVGLALKNIHG